jgi:hypothetical protein
MNSEQHQAQISAVQASVNGFPLPLCLLINMNNRGNGVCRPEWENRLTVSALITPAKE